MKRNKENSFTKKFDLLNSQNQNEDIRWSSSESSDYDNVINSYGPSSLKKHRKRKRKKTLQNNPSNTSLSVIKTTKKQKVQPDKSPIISRLYIETKQCGEKSSPILPTKVSEGDAKREVKSPVLLLKQKSSVLSPTIKKRLFVANDQSELNITESPNVSTNTELKQLNNCKNEIYTEAVKSISHNNNHATGSYTYSTEKTIKECQNKTNICNFNTTKVLKTNSDIAEHNVSKPRSKLDLVKRVQSYFDSQFGSDNASEQSISETETLTQKSDAKSSDDLEITNTLTQNKDNPSSEVFKSNSILSHGSWVNLNADKTKKTKYKKDGLAFRLDQLLKKQNANISLWQHEKFLAQNSKFVIPKSEHIVFRVKKINFKYGCYLLETVDSSGGLHLIYINGYYVNNACNIVPDVVLKLFTPYKILDLNDQYKIVINVCKFEFVPIVS